MPSESPVHPGAGERLEDKGDFPRFLRDHYRVAAEEHGANLATIERLLHDGGFISVAHQNGDIPGAQRLLTAAEAALAAVGGIEQAHDFGSGIFGQQFTGLGLVEALVRIFLEQPELQRRRVCAGREQLFTASVLGLDRLERDGVADKRVVATGKQAVDRCNHVAGRSVVGVQIIVIGGITPGLNIGIYIGAAKGVNRLLGIAYHQQSATWLWLWFGVRLGLGAGIRILLRQLRRVDAGENCKLQRIRILKFVDKRHREAFAYLLLELLTYGKAAIRRRLGQAAYGLGQGQQQIVRAQQVALGLELGKTLGYLALA